MEMYNTFEEDPLSELCLELYIGKDDNPVNSKRNISDFNILSSRDRRKFQSRDVPSNKFEYYSAQEWADDIVENVDNNFKVFSNKDAIKELTYAAYKNDNGKLLVKIGANSPLNVTDRFDVSKNKSSFNFAIETTAYRGGRMGAWSDGARRAKLGNRVDGQVISLGTMAGIYLIHLYGISPYAFYLTVDDRRKTQRLPRNMFMIFCSKEDYEKKYKRMNTFLNQTLEKVIQSKLGSAD